MIERSASDEIKKLLWTVMRSHSQHWHSQVATGTDEVLAAVGTERMTLQAEDTGSGPLLEPGAHCRDSAGLLLYCFRSVRRML